MNSSPNELFITAVGYLIAMTMAIICFFLDGDALRTGLAATSGVTAFATIPVSNALSVVAIT